jgi:NADPH-dependent 2,4-dienoyl-CoA reductase/sulfur reductase-like enzyme
MRTRFPRDRSPRRDDCPSVGRFGENAQDKVQLRRSNQDEIMPAKPNHHVVIVGGGFAGLYAAQSLRRPAVKVTLITTSPGIVQR